MDLPGQVVLSRLQAEQEPPGMVEGLDVPDGLDEVHEKHRAGQRLGQLAPAGVLRQPVHRTSG